MNSKKVEDEMAENSLPDFSHQSALTRLQRAEAFAAAGSLQQALASGVLPRFIDTTVSEALVLGLIAQGVRKFVAVFGHGTTEIGEVLRVYQQAGLARVFNVRSELEASHAATALRWVSGEKAAVVTSIGPGALQALAASLVPASDGMGVWYLLGDETTEDEGPNMQQIPRIYRGSYCDGSTWGSTFDYSDVAYINNDNKPGVWTVLSCSSAHFDGTTTTAELMLQRDYTTPATPKGAVAFVGSQAYTHYDYNNPFDEGFYRCWTDSGKSILGEAFLSGKIWAWNHMYPGFDPTSPRVHDEGIHHSGRSFTAGVDRCPADHQHLRRACHSGGGANVERDRHRDGSDQRPGRRCTGLPAQVRRSLCLGVHEWRGPGDAQRDSRHHRQRGSTVTAYNQQPVLSTVPVLATTGPYVVYDANTILGDGYADVGDTVSMNIQLRNVGTQTAPSVQSTLSTTQPAILMINATRGYGNIAAGSTAIPYSPFRFRVGTMVDQTSVPFSLAIHSGDSLWSGSFSTTVRAPIVVRLGLNGAGRDGQWQRHRRPGGNGGCVAAIEEQRHGAGTVGGADPQRGRPLRLDQRLSVPEPRKHPRGDRTHQFCIQSGDQSVMPPGPCGDAPVRTHV